MRRAFVLVSVAALAGCVLFVDAPDEVYARCRFDGEETACGTCLRASCQPQIDACCTGSCDPALVDRCANGGGCAALRANASFAACAKDCTACP